MSDYAGDLTPQEAWALLADDPRAVLVDVRTDDEWHRIGVPDTTTLPPGDDGRPGAGRAGFVEWVDATGAANPRFLAGLADLGVSAADPRPVVLLCRSGVRSVAAARAVTASGLGPAYNVLTGFEGPLGPDGLRGHAGWQADGLPWRTR